MVLLIVAAFVGLAGHYLVLVSAIGGDAATIGSVVTGKAVFAVVGGYLSQRALRMSRAECLTVVGALDLIPLLMPVLAAKPGWLLFIAPDIAAGMAGIALAREVDKRATPPDA